MVVSVGTRALVLFHESLPKQRYAWRQGYHIRLIVGEIGLLS